MWVGPLSAPSDRLSVPIGSVFRMSSAAFRPALAVRVLMLATAYSPLLLLLAVLNSFQIDWLRGVLVAVCLLGAAGTALFFLVAVKRRNAWPEAVYSVRPREGEALRFFASYVVPFFVTPSAPPAARWGLLIYLALIAVLYLQGDLYFCNPLLALFGYRVFELSRQDRDYVLVVSRCWHLSPGQQLQLVPLGGYLHLHRPAPKGSP